jgi:hypothetical protein
LKPVIRRLKPQILSLALALLAFIIYLRGTAPSVATIFDDSLEFPLVVHRLAIAHPTGYPLYILLGKLFSLFNPGNIAYQLNLMSAFFAALTVALVYQLGLALWVRLQANTSTVPPPTAHAGAVLGALLFGLGPVFFSQATIAEVYTLNAFFIAAVLLLALRQQWLGLAFIFGLSLAHHRTMLLLLPALLVYIWRSRPIPRPTKGSFWPKIALAFILPLLLYLYLPLRGIVGSLDGTYQPTWAGFWHHVLGGGYGLFLLGNPFNQQRTAAFYGQLILTELGWWGIGLGAAGLIWLLLRRRWPALLLTGLAFLTYLTFNLFYAVSDIAVFFIPVFLLWALWAGLALAGGLSWLWERQPWPAGILAGAALLLLVSQGRGHSRAGDWAVHDYGRDVLSQPLPEDAAVVGILGEMTLLRYFQETANLRPDVQTYAADLEADRLARVSELLSRNPEQAVYLTRELPGAAGRWSLSAEGPLIRVHPTPVRQKPVTAHDVAIPLIPEITLVGYTVTYPETHQATRSIRLTLVWRANAAIPGDYKISARLLDSAGEVAAVVDKVPVHFAYPTSAWRPGEFIADVYDLHPPPDALPGPYTPLLILYDPAQNAAELGRATLPALNY